MNAYEVEAGMVYLQVKLCDPCSLKVRCSENGAIDFLYYLYLYLSALGGTVIDAKLQKKNVLFHQF